MAEDAKNGQPRAQVAHTSDVDGDHSCFDLHSPPLGEPPCEHTELMTMSAYLKVLKQTGKISDPKPLSRRALDSANTCMSKVAPSVAAEAPSLPPSPRSWRNTAASLALRPPRRVFVKAPGQWFVFGDGHESSCVRQSTTVGHIRRWLWGQLLPGPRTQLRLEHWGLPLLNDSSTLAAAGVPDGGKLHARLVESRPGELRGLERVRIVSSALGTRALAVDRTCTAFDLKVLICASFSGSEMTFWAESGKRVHYEKAVTLIALESAAAGPAEGGTSELRQGEELVVDPYQAASLKGGKGHVNARRVALGQPKVHGQVATVADTQVWFVELRPEQLRLSLPGPRSCPSLEKAELDDGVRLWELGVRDDDALAFEFESPASPELLKLVRSPAAEKPGKGSGGKGKKKGK